MNKSLIIFYIIGIFSVLSISLITYFIVIRYHFRRFNGFLYFLILSSVYLIFSQFFKYHSLHYYVDFSHWTQILYNIVSSGKPLSLNQEFLVPGTMNYLSVHFVPLIYLLALPFRLWPYSETLMILNFLLMTSSIIPLYKLAESYQKNKQFGLFMVALLLWYPTFQYILLYEFEMLRFSIPIILWMLYFWKKRKTGLYFIFVILAVLVREEVGLTIMMFGLYLLLFEKRRKVGMVTAVIGLISFIIITQMIMPALRSSDGYVHIAMGSFSALGNSFGEIIMNIVKHPLETLVLVLKPIKLANLFMIFLPLLFIPLCAPIVLINTFANFGVLLLSESLHLSYMLFYVSPSIPFIFLALIKGWPKLTKYLNKRGNKNWPKAKVNVNSPAMKAVLVGLLVSNVFFGPSPISLQFWFKDLRPAPFATQNFHYSVYEISNHHRKAREFCKLIPDSAIVSAQHFFHPRLFKKKGTMIFPRLESLDNKYKADYVLFDKTNNYLKKGSPSYKTQHDFDVVEKDKRNWQLVKSENGLFLYKRIK